MAEGEVDEDDVQELTEAVEEDAQVFSAMQNALRNLLRAEGAAFPIQPILPFLDLMSGTSEAPTYFALKLFSDIIQSTGEASPALVGPYLDRVLVALTDVGACSFLSGSTRTTLISFARRSRDEEDRCVRRWKRS